MIDLCLSLLLGLVRGACETYSGKTARYNGPSSDCVQITDCYFKGCNANSFDDKSGGAVKLSYSGATASVERCTFEDCWAKSGSFVDDDMGGALFVEIAKLTMSECCGKGCWCNDLGQFLFIREKGVIFGSSYAPVSTISQVTVFGSLYKNDEQEGTINLNDGETKADHVNLTDNHANIGCGISTATSQTLTECKFLTVVENTGNSLFACRGTSLVYTYSNFVDNQASCTFLLIERTVEVSYCLFRRNQVNFGRPRSGSNGMANVANCIFDDVLESTIYLILGHNKYGNTDETTIKMCQLNTRFCVATLPCDFTKPFTVSEAFLPSTDFSESKEFAASSEFAATQHFTETHSFTETSSFSETQCFSQSSQMTQSEDFTTSDSFTASVSSASPTSWFSVTDSSTSICTQTFALSSDATSQMQDRTATLSQSGSNAHEHALSPSTHNEKSSQVKERTTTDEGSKSKSLSMGIIIGIVVGVVVLIVVVIIVIVVVAAKRRKDDRTTSTTEETNTATELDTENTTTDTQWESITEINPMFADTMDGQMNDDVFDNDRGCFPE